MEDKQSMTNPKIEDLLEHTENKFTLVVEAAKRARQITNFQKRLGEGLGGVAPMSLEDISKKPLTVAFEEIAGGEIEYIRPAPGEEELEFEPGDGPRLLLEPDPGGDDDGDAGEDADEEDEDS